VRGYSAFPLKTKDGLGGAPDWIVRRVMMAGKKRIGERSAHDFPDRRDVRRLSR